VSHPVLVSIQSRPKNLNVRSETVKLLQEIIGKTLEHVGIGNNFVNRNSIAQQLRESLTNGTEPN
jgi:hypothetical protein